jgi:hypothetical protein
MSDEDLGVLAIPIVGMVAVFGAWLIFAVNNALPWSTVSPQAQSVGASAANTAVTVLGIDPTTFLIAVALIAGGIVSLIALIARLSGGGGGSDYE